MNKDNLDMVAKAIIDIHAEFGVLNLQQIHRKLRERWPNITMYNIKRTIATARLDYLVHSSIIAYNAELAKEIRKLTNTDGYWTIGAVAEHIKSLGIKTPCTPMLALFMRKYGIDPNQSLKSTINRIYTSRPIGGWKQCDFIVAVMDELNVSKNFVIYHIRANGLKFSTYKTQSEKVVRKLVDSGKLNGIDGLTINNVHKRVIESCGPISYDCTRKSVNIITGRLPKKRRSRTEKVTLTDDERSLLNNIINVPSKMKTQLQTTLTRRAQVALMFADGKSCRDITKATGYAVPTIAMQKRILFERGLSNFLQIDVNAACCSEKCKWTALVDNYNKYKYKTAKNMIIVDGIIDSGYGWSKRLGFKKNYINRYIRKHGMEDTILFIKKKLIPCKNSEIC